MRTHTLKKIWSIFLVASVCLIVSCSDDKAPVLTDSAEMYGKDLVFRNDELSLQINGDSITNVVVQFEPVKDDSTLLVMSIYNYVPDRLVDIVVKVTPNEGFVTFEGAVDGNLESYHAEVKGIYHSDADGKGTVEANCTISAAYWFADVPFEYHFAEDLLHVTRGSGDSIEWKGQEVSKWDFVQSVLDKISLRFAKEITDVKLMFHTNATFDIWLKRAGQSDYEHWMTPRFWIDHQKMLWIFTREQKEQFCAQWLGDFDGTFPFRETLDGHYELSIFCWAGSTSFTWTIDAYRYDALDMFLQGKGMKGLSEEEKDEMEMFREILVSDWDSWIIIMSSEEK